MRISKTLKRIKKAIKFLLFILIFIISITFIIKLSAIKNQSENKPLNITTEESLINEIKSTSKIIPLEVELSKFITIDKSWGSLEVFQKYKRIKFYANCSFYIDLSKLKKEDISLDESDLTITVSNPQIFTIDILREKTTYEDSTNGLLRFGEITLTSEEFDEIQEEVYKSFEETLNEKDIYDQAIYNSKISLTNLFKQIIGDDININILFK